MPKRPGELICGTDGFRDRSTNETGGGKMNPETIADLTSVLLDYQLEAGQSGPIVIAQDTRRFGQSLRLAALAAAEQKGVEAIDIGINPTPAAQKIAGEIGAIATVVISASHNPAEYNGWKGMIGNRKPGDHEIKDLSRRYWQRAAEGTAATPVKPANTPFEQRKWREWYIDSIAQDISEQFGEGPLKGKLFVIDGAHGAASDVTPAVFEKLGATVNKFSCEPGEINKDCGAANLDGLKSYLANHPRDILKNPNFVGAIANDGDADRVMAIGLGSHGELVEINGNHMMYALATDPKQPGIVGTVYTNYGLRTRLGQEGITFDEVGNGDRFVTDRLIDRQNSGDNWTRGGEFTGHLIDTNWLNSGDGVHMAAWFAAYMAQSDKTFGDLHADLPLWHEDMISKKLPEGTKLNIEGSVPIQSALRQAEKLDTKIVLRASGTEPLVRIFNQSPRRITTKRVGKMLSEAIALELAK